jgi:hypothetical protein
VKRTRKIDTNTLLPFTYDEILYIITAEKKKASVVVRATTEARCNRRVDARSTLCRNSSDPADVPKRGRPVDMRQLKGLEIAARFKIDFKDGVWVVPSSSGNGKYQVVLDANGDTCSCEDFGLRRLACKHIYASKIVRDRDHGGKNPPFEVREDEAIPKRQTYKQNWPLYNEAQVTEKRRFQVLLADLCRYVPQLPNPHRGQQRAPTADVVFAMVFKVYTMLSSRRFTCDLEDACTKGHVAQAIHYNSLCRAFEMPEMTPILRDLITRSSLPLRAVEDTFAPDSTGFSTSRFIRW